MITILVAGVLALGALQQQTDTTLAVQAGGTLEVHSFGGRVTVRSWDRSQVRIRATHSDGTRVQVRQRGNDVRVDATGRGGMPVTNVRFDVLVPRSYNIRMEGVNLSADVEGIRGAVQVGNVEGSLNLRDIAGNVTVESVSGPLRIDNVTGRISATAVNQNVQVSRARGPLSVETVNGSVVIRDADTDNVNLSTINGFIEYDGAVRDGGRYFLATHNGRITMSVPAQANARITITATTGKVEAAFPVSFSTSGDERFAFSIGTGSARVELESFNGTIRLVRPGGR
jgi:DUF4097 and DUF4098 domain-containing protein YvlB